LEYEKGCLKLQQRAAMASWARMSPKILSTIESVPLVLERPVDVIVEGEVWMSEKTLEE
jgi:hypothetical protein